MTRPDLSKYEWIHSTEGVMGGDVSISRFPVHMLLRALAKEPTVLAAIDQLWFDYDSAAFAEAFLYAADCVEAFDEVAP